MVAIKTLKRGKACSCDLINNEMLKYSTLILIPVINKLFNFVLETRHYPSLWRGSWLKPIHKGGDMKDPNRYKVIAVMSCIGKNFLLNTK